MPSPLTVHCPACDAALKLRNRQYVGKRVACPKCRKPFVVADPGDVDDDFSALDDFDSYEDAADDDEYERPAARRSAPRPAARGKAGSAGRRSARSAKPAGKSRKPARRQRSNLPFIIGGAVVGLAVLVGLGFLVTGMLGKSTTPTASIQEFSYLPSDSEALVKMRLADVMNSPWQQQLMNPQQQQAMNTLKAQTGIDIMQIESMSVGISGLNPAALSGQGMGAGGPMGALMNPNLKFVVLVRSRTAFPEDRIRNSSKALSHNGETYYMDRSGGMPIALYLPDDRTMVVGREVDVKRAIDQGASPPAMPQFGFADLNQHVGVAFVPSDRSFLQNLQVPDVPGFPAVKKAGDTLKSVVGGAFSLNYGADAVDVEISVRLGTDADAVQLKAALDELIPQGKQMMGAFAGSADPQTAKGVTVANQVLNTLIVSQTGDLVSARLSLSRQAAADFQALGNLQGF